MRVVYDETEDCNACLYNKHGMCYKLSRPLKELCFEMDCPLPHKSIVEKFTRYITKNKSIFACGNCKYWKRWDYNQHLCTDVGICTCPEGTKLSVRCNDKACNHFEEV